MASWTAVDRGCWALASLLLCDWYFQSPEICHSCYLHLMQAKLCSRQPFSQSACDFRHLGRWYLAPDFGAYIDCVFLRSASKLCNLLQLWPRSALFLLCCKSSGSLRGDGTPSWKVLWLWYIDFLLSSSAQRLDLLCTLLILVLVEFWFYLLNGF